MNRPSAPRAPTRTLAQHEDTQHLESVIAKSPAARPIDTSMLRRGVWTYVGEERQAATSPRRAILWCVEAYFGQLGDQILGAPAPDPTLAECTAAQL